MKKLITISLFIVTFCCINLLNAQITKQSQWKGVPCEDCVAPGASTEKGGSNSVQNGNGSIATSYTATACGLNFTQATVRLNKRAFTGMTTQTGVNQPATFAISGIPACFTIKSFFIYRGFR